MTTLVFVLWAAAGSVQDPLPEPVRPLFREFCWDCHAGDSAKGGFSLDSAKDLNTLVSDKKRWAKAILLLQSHVMPPAKKPQPSSEQRRALLDWIERAVFPVDPERPDPGQPVLRRLNRAEYNNAVHDVFRIDSRPADVFPSDDSGYGFDTVGDVLTLSPTLLEKVLTAAKQVAEEATLPRTVGQVGIERQGAQLEIFRGQAVRERNTILLQGEAEAGVRADLGADAVYRVLLLASAPRPTRLDVLCDGERIHTFELPETAKKVQTVYALVPLSGGRRRISVRVQDAGSVSIQAFRLRGPFDLVRPPLPAFLADLLGPTRALSLPRLGLSGEDTEKGEGPSTLDTGAALFTGDGYRWTPLVVGKAGRYRMRFKAGAQQAGAERVQFEVRVGARRLGPFSVAAAEQRSEWIDAETDLDAGPQELQIWFVNAAKGRSLWIHEFLVEGPLGSDRPLTHAEVPDLLARTARRLYRRSVGAEESARLGELVRRAEKSGQPALAAFRHGLVALLSSPSFLYWNDPVPAGPPARGSAEIDEIALASRLSAFLWSSVPDEELLRLAESGGLRKEFRAQVVRLLADSRSRALTENFAGQWLELRNMSLVAPDPTAFPGWSAALAADLRRETELLFEHVLHENRPVLELLSADYTFANARVAAHYGLPGVAGEEFRRVSLAGTARRGLLSHGSLLTFTSHPNRTSPVKRGKFVLEKILGTPPPPAPKDVPPLAEGSPEVRGLSMRRRLEVHRANPACASCHAFMDPPGFALEHFDAVGRYRETDEGRPVDASGRLVTGDAFRNAEELARILVERRSEDVVRSLAEQLLTYALGRGIEPADRLAVREIVARAGREGWRFHALILAVGESVPFQRMRDPGPK